MTTRVFKRASAAALSAAVLTALVLISPLYADAASPPSPPAPSRAPDLRVHPIQTHAPGAAATPDPTAFPLRSGPHPAQPNHPVPAPLAAAPIGPLVGVSSNLNQPGLAAAGLTPSDSTGAIGPAHYIEVVNAQVGLFDRSLASSGTAGLSTFVGAASGLKVGDPQVQWDQQWGRWVYAALEIDPNATPSLRSNGLAFGWSKNGDPANLSLANSDWCNFHIPTATEIHDYPKLGHDTNFILLGVNIYSSSEAFVSAGIYAVPKPVASQALACVPAPTVSRFGGAGTAQLRHLSPVFNPVFTPVPANTADNAATGYIVATDLSYIGAWHVSLLPVGACTLPPCLVADGEIPITPWSEGPGSFWGVPQPGNMPLVNALDGRLTQAVQLTDPQAGASAVWTQHTIQESSGRTVVSWYQLVPAACGGGVCGPAANRQEGVLTDPNLWLFNAAISPTSTGNAAFIHYNTGSPSTFIDVRAQGRSIADPRSVMSGELILRGSTVADNDFSCSGTFGPPCRWGDYSGASPDPASCSTVWGSNMLSGDTASTGPPTWVSQNFALTEGAVRSTVTTQQYTLSGSDGQTWTDMDSSRLRLGSVPCTGSTALITANADLFTSRAGINQDIGVFVDVDGVQSTVPVVWKESGGFNGTFSPNAAYAQATVPMPAGHSYDVRLKWKANKATSGSIHAGAGPLPGAAFSPTRLTLELFPTSPDQTSTNTQPKNVGSDGATWVPIPSFSPISLAPIADSKVLLTGSADLWTDTAGYNQDIGIRLSGGTFGIAGLVVAWKESGGFNGTFSPNAASVQATANLTGGQAYTATLVWKTNRPAPAAASIYAGAGPLPGAGGFSPTSLIATSFAAGLNPVDVVSTVQFSLPGSDGSTWTPLGALQASVTASASTQALVEANVDLFTANSGYNQDVAIFATDNGGPSRLLAWKESGGFGGTFSPNAAFAQTVYPMVSGHTYVFSLRWKTNRSTGGSGATIYAGGGPISGAYSPTRLLIELAA